MDKILTGQQTVEKLDSWSSGSDVFIKCPECDFEHTHMIGVGSLAPLAENGGEGMDCYPGTKVIGTNKMRRAAVAIIMECENGPHRFAFVVQQHKGVNYIEMHSPFTQADGTDVAYACAACGLTDAEVKNVKDAPDQYTYWCPKCQERWSKLRKKKWQSDES
jgi:hypothetical protein